jgi:4-amino-4-deoxy-L-arabinose transferase-like glycosyltransferase
MLKLDHQRRTACLLAVLGLALILRVLGLDWGLPGRPDMHPDEHDYVVSRALGLSLTNLDPGWYNYPAFLMYLIAGTRKLLVALSLIGGAEWQAYLIGRIWAALFSTATVWAVYRLARELRASGVAALLAALWTAWLPQAVWDAHAATTDSLMTFWILMTLWSAVKVARAGRIRDYALGGMCLGLAAGSKYTAAMAVVALLAGAACSRRPLREFLPRLALAGVLSLVFAFAVMPFSFIHLPKLLAAMSYEHRHTVGHHSGFSLPAPGWQYHHYIYQMFAAWPFSFGIALYACVVPAMLWTALRANRLTFPLLAFAAVFFGVTGSWNFTPLRYYLPLVVLGCLFTGLWMASMLESASPSVRRVGSALFSAALVYTAIFTIQTDLRYTRETRDVAGRWLDENLRSGGTLVLCGWHRYMAEPSNRNAYTIVEKKQEGVIANIPDDAECDLIETTSLHYQRHVRHADQAWLDAYWRLKDKNGAFERVAKFEARFINRHLYMKLDPMFGGYFVSPTLEFYRARHPRPGSTIPLEYL